MSEPIIPIREAAHRLGISIWTARKKAYSGEIASVKIGAKLLIPGSEIERVISEGLRPRRIQSDVSAKVTPEARPGTGCTA
jgi:excisionase family DNA binding protein